MPRRLWIVAAVVVALVAAGGVWWWRHRPETPLAWAVDHAPAGTQRLSWTDWAAVRRQEHAVLSARSSADQLQRFLRHAYDADLDSTSTLVTSSSYLQEHYGFSPANADWELYSQSYQGAAVMLHLGSADFGAIADDLRELGYREPAHSDGVWLGGPDLLARLSPSLTGELQYVVLDSADHLVLTSDTAAYAEIALKAVQGSGARLTGLDSVVHDAGQPLSAAVYTGTYACGALAMAHAGGADQAEGRRLLAAAGQANPYSAFAMSEEPDGTVRVSFDFDSSSTARTNADTRAKLARGPAPGQGGTFGERFTISSVTARGSVVRMVLRPRSGESVLSDLSTGPLLFATC